MSLSLYQLSHEFQQAVSQLNEMDLPAEAIADTLEALELDVRDKGRNVAAYILNCKAEAAAIKEAEQKMAARRKTLENQYKRLQAYLHEHMTACEISEITCPEFAVKIKKNPPALHIADDAEIPPEFKTEEVVVKVDKTALKNAIKGGAVFKGVTLEQTTRADIK